jgi:hypothetical protein
MACRTAESRKSGAKDVNTMSDNSHISQRIHLLLARTLRVDFRRASLAAIALFCIAAATAPPVSAQTGLRCGFSINLLANQWRMVGVPCVPPTNSRTVAGVFGSSLGANSYGVTWIAWKRVYDDSSQCVVSSGPADCYVKLTLTSPANVGDAFWIYTTVNARVQFPSNFNFTPGPNFQFPATLTTGSTTDPSRYYMFANPYSRTVNWADLRFAIQSFELSTANAVALSLISKNVNYWNGNTYFTRDLNAPAATFQPKEAAWLEWLPLPFIPPSGATVIVPQP